jgi:hypothetical protein
MFDENIENANALYWTISQIVFGGEISETVGLTPALALYYYGGKEGLKEKLRELEENYNDMWHNVSMIAGDICSFSLLPIWEKRIALRRLLLVKLFLGLIMENNPFIGGFKPLKYIKSIIDDYVQESRILILGNLE